jgi:iron transport multicopper oxidase
MGILFLIQLFHCHVEWHLQAGLGAQFIEAPLIMQTRIKLPESFLNVCRESGVGTTGNALGLEGLEQLESEKVLGKYREYLETKGVVALVSCICSAIAGLIVIIMVS